MKVETPEKTLTLTLNEEEIKYLRDITQNAAGAEVESYNRFRMAFYVAASRALGYDMNNDGTINRSKL